MHSMHTSGVAATAVLAIGASAAAGLINPVGPFVGDRSEGFEGFTYGEVLPGAYDVFDGAGTIEFQGDPAYYLWVYSEPGTGFAWPLGDGQEAGLHDGEKGMALDGANGDLAILNFDEPIDSFGGYWAVETDVPFIDFRFYGANDALIGSTQVTYDAVAENGELAWHGWTSPSPISRIEIEGNFVAFDGLQILSVPQPGVLAGAALLLIGGRRRRPNPADS